MNVSQANQERIKTECYIIDAATRSSAGLLAYKGGYKDIEDLLQGDIARQVEESLERINALGEGTGTADEPNRESIKREWQSIAVAIGLLEVVVVPNDDLQDFGEDLREHLRRVFQEDVRRQVRDGLETIETLKRPAS